MVDLMSTFSSQLDSPSSFHPVSHISLLFSPPDAELFKDKCSLHVYYQLPSSVFIDPYELVQRQEAYTFVQWGHVDLEKPVHAVEESNISLLINVKIPQTWTDNISSLSFAVTVPLHARYGIPSPSTSSKSLNGTYHDVALQLPRAFLTCKKQPQHSPTPLLNLSETQLYEAGFEPNMTTFLHLNHSSSDYVNTIRVPLGHGEDLYWVQSGTASIILVCFIWVTITAVRTAARLNPVPNSLQGKID